MRLLTPQQAADLEVDSVGWTAGIEDDDRRARRYLAFATEDLSDNNTQRSAVNAVGNAKRALHLRVEHLARAYGGEALIERRARFPELLEFCRRSGIVSPVVLRRLNATRNKVEHDYYLPTTDEASDFVDIVALFVEATDRLAVRFPDLVELVSSEEKHGVHRQILRVKCTPNSGVIELEYYDLDIDQERLDQLAAARKEELVQQADRATASGNEVVLQNGDLDEVCYRWASKEFWRESVHRHSVDEGDPYFGWIQLLIKKSK